MKLQEVIILALNEVEYKISKGKFFINDIDLCTLSTELGNPENVHTIAAMYAQFVTDHSYDDAMSEIEDAIIKKYSWCYI